MFLQNKFRQYYREMKSTITIPEKIMQREFGFFHFNSVTMRRHVGFQSENSLIKYLVSYAPKHVFYSTAFYENPAASIMAEKNWLGAELVFDIDADHLDTPCKKEHDLWVCSNCGHKGKGMPPSKCPKCGSDKIKVKKWLCEQCLDTAKHEVFKIIEDFLIPDFGISKKELSVVFSGHRGYHVHVFSDFVRDLNQRARRELVDYLTGIGIVPKYFGFGRIMNEPYPSLKSPGWKGRIIRYLLNLMDDLDKFDYRWALNLEKHKSAIVSALSSSRPNLSIIPRISDSTWQEIAKFAAHYYSAKIDEPVTYDTKRLIRLPGSLHGGTGFKVMNISFNDLESYDPFKEAIFFRGELTIHINESPKIRIGDEYYGPYNDVNVEVPMAVAIFMLCKGVATLELGV